MSSFKKVKMSKIFYQFTTYDSGKRMDITYIFYEDGTYRCDHWVVGREKENGAKWRASERGLEFWMKSNGRWLSFDTHDGKAEEFYDFCTGECALRDDE